MKAQKFASFFQGLGVALSVFAAKLALAAGPVPQLVSSLDLNRFEGRWYELASSVKGESCNCPSSEFSLAGAGVLNVLASCQAEGALLSSEGTLTAKQPNAKLQLSLAGKDAAPFWIVDRADDYRYFVVSNAFRSSIRIFSRSPELAPADRQAIRKHLQEDGFNLLLAKPTSQLNCSY